MFLFPHQLPSPPRSHPQPHSQRCRRRRRRPCWPPARSWAGETRSCPMCVSKRSILRGSSSRARDGWMGAGVAYSYSSASSRTSLSCAAMDWRVRSTIVSTSAGDAVVGEVDIQSDGGARDGDGGGVAWPGFIRWKSDLIEQQPRTTRRIQRWMSVGVFRGSACGCVIKCEERERWHSTIRAGDFGSSKV
jgi:hypothetical protein